MLTKLAHLIRRRNNDQGFTLIELMVVIAIIGILAAVAVPRFAGSLDTANEAKAQADYQAVLSALELYYLENEAYPANLNTLADDYLNNISADDLGEYDTDWSYTPDADNNNKSYNIYSADTLWP